MEQNPINIDNIQSLLLTKQKIVQPWKTLIERKKKKSVLLFEPKTRLPSKENNLQKNVIYIQVVCSLDFYSMFIV